MCLLFSAVPAYTKVFLQLLSFPGKAGISDACCSDEYLFLSNKKPRMAPELLSIVFLLSGKAEFF